MDSETHRIYDRMRLYFLMKDHPKWRPEDFAEVIGRTSRWVRDWQKRYDTDQPVTLELFKSRSRAPHTRPRLTSPEVKQAIGHLREHLSKHYHRKAGARLILHELQKQSHLYKSGCMGF